MEVRVEGGEGRRGRDIGGKGERRWCRTERGVVQVVVEKQCEEERKIESVFIPSRETKEGQQNAHFFATLWISATPTASIAASISFGVDLLPVVTSWRPKSSATAVVPSSPRRSDALS
jgi:hypothetical protein